MPATATLRYPRRPTCRERDYSLIERLALAPEETCLTTADVATLSGFSPAALRLWRREGRGPRCVLIEQRRPRYFWRDVKAWLAAFDTAAAA